jgi:DNA repair exonuclease SbcCD nuclease subunit
MKLLLQSDSQAEFSNLDLCEQSHQELLKAIQVHKPDAVIHGGDLKESYNPIDVRVAKFWVKATRQIVDTGVPFYINLGNHDRISQSRESKNWLDILRVAGATTFTKPRIKRVADGAIAFLPYTADKALERKWAKQLAIDVQEYIGPKALIFHTEVAGALLNTFGTKAVGNDHAGLCFDKYDVCLGGHIHGFQQIGGNAFYIGSPFCQDWGEADQQKGLVLVTIE